MVYSTGLKVFFTLTCFILKNTHTTHTLAQPTTECYYHPRSPLVLFDSVYNSRLIHWLFLYYITAFVTALIFSYSGVIMGYNYGHMKPCATAGEFLWLWLLLSMRRYVLDQQPLSGEVLSYVRGPEQEGWSFSKLYTNQSRALFTLHLPPNRGKGCQKYEECVVHSEWPFLWNSFATWGFCCSANQYLHNIDEGKDHQVSQCGLFLAPRWCQKCVFLNAMTVLSMFHLFPVGLSRCPVIQLSHSI